MPVVLLFTLALTAGLAVGLLAWRYPRTADPAARAARKVGEEAEAHPGLRAALAPRLDPEVATGLALTLALVLAIAGGVLFGVLAYLVRTNAHLLGIDRSVARWGNAHASTFSTHVLNGVTQLGSIYVVVVLCVILATVETAGAAQRLGGCLHRRGDGGRGGSRAHREAVGRPGQADVQSGCRDARAVIPERSLGDSGCVLCDGCAVDRPPAAPPQRAALIGLAAGIAVGVAASRVLLDVHWLTDVIAGLALGWAWFAVCSIAFGGRILRFGAGAELAAQAAASPSAGRVRRSGSASSVADSDPRHG